MLRYPENSRLGLQAALEAGADFIEFDLQMNADQEFIAIHDDNFQRTAGVPLSVFAADMQACRDISVHQAELFGDAFLPTPVSTLTEVLTLLDQYPKSRAMVEIKAESIQHWGLERVMDQLINELDSCRERCVLISFSADAIEYAQQHSFLKTGWVLEVYDQAHRARAARIQPDYLMTDYQILPDGEVLWSEFDHWMLYDIVDPVIAARFADMGVELIETADIEGLRRFFIAPVES